MVNLEQYRQQLIRIKHLLDVDELWDTNQLHSDELVALKIRTEETNTIIAQHRKHSDEALKALSKKGQNTFKLATKNQNHLVNLEQYRQQLIRIKHLLDVDELWDTNQLNSDKLVTLERSNEETKEAISQNKKLSDEAIRVLAQKSDTAVHLLTKNVRYIHIIAGTSLSLAVIQLLYIVVRLYVG